MEREEIADQWQTYYSRREFSDKWECAERGGVFPAKGFLSLIMQIPGIMYASVTGYKLVVQKAPPFSWDEIEPRVRETIKGLEHATAEMVSEEE